MIVVTGAVVVGFLIQLVPWDGLVENKWMRRGQIAFFYVMVLVGILGAVMFATGHIPAAS